MNKEKRNSYNAQRKCADKTAFCHAPAMSMYFGMTGTASACCYNRTDAYGIYPEVSVKDMWQSAVRESLNEAMHSKSDILPNGCRLCALPYEAGNYQNMVAAGFDDLPVAETSWLKRVKSAFKKPQTLYPLQMEFELSNTCNLECAMCNGLFSSLIREKREKLPPIVSPYDKAFIEQLREFIPHLKRARFYGGEPFLIPIYHDIWDAMIELNEGMDVVITTNATVLNERVKRVLNKLNCDLVLSIDSRVKPTYEQIRVGANYERVMEHVDYFVQKLAPLNKLSIAICPMPVNATEMPDMLMWCNQNNVKIYFNVVSLPIGASFRSMTAEDLSRVSLQYDSFVCPTETEMQRYNAVQFEGLRRQVRHWAEEAAQNKEKNSALYKLLNTEQQKESFLALVVSRELTFRLRPNVPPDDILAYQELKQISSPDLIAMYLQAGGETYIADKMPGEADAREIKERIQKTSFMISQMQIDHDVIVKNMLHTSPCMVIEAILTYDEQALAAMVKGLVG